MNKELKEKWVAALRSGKFKKGRGLLFDPSDNSYCCLGVLARIAGKVPETVKCDSGAEFLHANFLEEIEFNFNQNTLAVMNDGRPASGNDEESITPKSFDEIADFIESNPSI